MNILSRTVIIIIITCLWNTLSCSLIGSGNIKHKSNFTTNGFLDANHFQAIVTGYPDNKDMGLVNKRESSIKKAKQKINKTVINQLSQYCIKYNARKNGITNTATIPDLMMKTIEIKQKLHPFLRYGQVAFKYYNEDHSAVIVYRIVKEELKNDIESIYLAYETNQKK